MNAEMSRDEMQAMLIQMQADNTALKAKLTEANKPKAISLKVSEKGALSVYGLGRFPATLYVGQWERLFLAHAQITDFIKANHTLLVRKA
jgi:hypothetical protein